MEQNVQYILKPDSLNEFLSIAAVNKYVYEALTKPFFISLNSNGDVNEISYDNKNFLKFKDVVSSEARGYGHVTIVIGSEEFHLFEKFEKKDSDVCQNPAKAYGILKLGANSTFVGYDGADTKEKAEEIAEKFVNESIDNQAIVTKSLSLHYIDKKVSKIMY